MGRRRYATPNNTISPAAAIRATFVCDRDDAGATVEMAVCENDNPLDPAESICRFNRFRSTPSSVAV